MLSLLCFTVTKMSFVSDTVTVSLAPCLHLLVSQDLFFVFSSKKESQCKMLSALNEMGPNFLSMESFPISCLPAYYFLSRCHI